MERRDFLIRASSAVALAVATGGAGLFFHNRKTSHYVPSMIKSQSFEVPPEPLLPKVTLAMNENHTTALDRALDAIGGIKRFIQPGQRVTIKPNVGWDRTPEQAANTNPELVGHMVSLCLSAGAEEVIVTDVTCNEARRCFLRSGIKETAEAAGAKVILPSKENFIDFNLGGELLDSWPVLKHFVQTDRLINMPIVKQHSLSSCTVGMKNLYGVLGGHRHKLHQQIDQSIVDLAMFCRPTLTVVDATRVLMRGGPQGGSLDDVKVENTVICATDQVAADSRAVEFLDLQAENVGHIVLAQEAGLGNINYRTAGYKVVS
ncbi:MAG: DUF362 domain-containing protein [candidate division Zixibacteria bacterium]|nr:DUF362 domain-containing protein [candidate division Zixibacteria bacterium]